MLHAIYTTPRGNAPYGEMECTTVTGAIVNVIGNHDDIHNIPKRFVYRIQIGQFTLSTDDDRKLVISIMHDDYTCTETLYDIDWDYFLDHINLPIITVSVIEEYVSRMQEIDIVKTHTVEL